MALIMTQRHRDAQRRHAHCRCCGKGASIEAMSQTDAAEMLNVSRASVQRVSARPGWHLASLALFGSMTTRPRTGAKLSPFDSLFQSWKSNQTRP